MLDKDHKNSKDSKISFANDVLKVCNVLNEVTAELGSLSLVAVNAELGIVSADLEERMKLFSAHIEAKISVLSITEEEESRLHVIAAVALHTGIIFEAAVWHNVNSTTEELAKLMGSKDGSKTKYTN